MKLYERHYNYDERIFRDESLVPNKELLKRKMSEKVGEEINRIKAFLKLKVYDGKFLYAKIEPKHYIEDLVLKELIKKYPNFTIVLSSSRGNFMMSKYELPFPIKDGVYFSESDPTPTLNRLPTSESLLKFASRQKYWDRQRSKKFFQMRSRQFQKRAVMRKAQRSQSMRFHNSTPDILMTSLLDFVFK